MSESAGQALRRIMGNAVNIEEEIPRLNALIYGNNGVGKTIFSIGLINQITPPDKKKIVLIDTSENWISLKNHPRIADRVIVLPFTNVHDVRVVAKAIKQGVGVYAEVGGIVLDQGSSIYQKTLDEDFLERIGGAPTRDDPTPEWSDYNRALFKYRTMVDDITAVRGLHVITTAHISEDKDKKGTVIRRFPNFSPSALNRVKEDLHLVGVLSAQERRDPNNFDANIYERTIQVHPTTLYDAKTKIPDLPIRLNTREFIPAVVDWIKSGAPTTQSDAPHVIVANGDLEVPKEEPDTSEGENESKAEIEIEADQTTDELNFDSQPFIVE